MAKKLSIAFLFSKQPLFFFKLAVNFPEDFSFFGSFTDNGYAFLEISSFGSYFLNFALRRFYRFANRFAVALRAIEPYAF